MQTSAVQVFLAVINLILCTQRMPCENSMKTCIGSILAVTILVLEVSSTPETRHHLQSVLSLHALQERHQYVHWQQRPRQGP